MSEGITVEIHDAIYDAIQRNEVHSGWTPRAGVRGPYNAWTSFRPLA